MSEFKNFSQFPRHRNLRQSANIRNLVSETVISKDDIILPLFVIEAKDQTQAIPTMPDVFRYGINPLLKHIEACVNNGIKYFALFPVIDFAKKSENAAEAFKKNNLIHQVLRAVKKTFPDAILIADVALDPYTSHGHDGVVINGIVDNDATVNLLCKQALMLADAGADIIAPSDMMDGRILQIRQTLNKAGFSQKLILSYCAKYASSFYGPFRQALNNKNVGISKASYQMDYRNSKEALKQAVADTNQGADFLMVKPAGYYLDIVKLLSEHSLLPTFAFQVSGEYTMLKLLAKETGINFNDLLLETLTCIKRAGASKVFCYGGVGIF